MGQTVFGFFFTVVVFPRPSDCCLQFRWHFGEGVFSAELPKFILRIFLKYPVKFTNWSGKNFNTDSIRVEINSIRGKSLRSDIDILSTVSVNGLVDLKDNIVKKPST